jgi:transcriptional regulator with XRE-family HTH domain
MKHNLSELTHTPSFEVESLLAHAALMLGATMEHEGLTQLQVAERSGQKQQAVSRILGAEYGMTLRTLARMAYAMGYRVRLEFEPLNGAVRPGSK